MIRSLRLLHFIKKNPSVLTQEKPPKDTKIALNYTRKELDEYLKTIDKKPKIK